MGRHGAERARRLGARRPDCQPVAVPHRHIDLVGLVCPRRDPGLHVGQHQHDITNGTLSIGTLAAEARLSLQRLCEHHAELLAEFKTVAGGPSPPNCQALQQRLADARARLPSLKGPTWHSRNAFARSAS